MKSAFTMLDTLVGAPQDTAPTAGTAGTDYALSEQTVDRMSSDKKAPAGVGPRATPDLSGGPPTGPWRRAAHAHITAKPRRARPQRQAREHICACAERSAPAGGGAGSAVARAQKGWRARGMSQSASERLSEFASRASCAVDARTFRGRSPGGTAAEAACTRREEPVACIRARPGLGKS